MVSEWLVIKSAIAIAVLLFSKRTAPSPPPELAAVPDVGFLQPQMLISFVLADPSQLFCLIPLGSGDI